MATSNSLLRRAWLAACALAIAGFLTLPATQRLNGLVFLAAVLVAPLFLTGAVLGLIGCLQFQTPNWRSYVIGWLLVVLAICGGIALDQPYRRLRFYEAYGRYWDFVSTIRSEPESKRVSSRRFTTSEKKATGAYDGTVSWTGSKLVVEFRTPNGMSVESVRFQSERVVDGVGGSFELLRRDDLGYWYFDNRP